MDSYVKFIVVIGTNEMRSIEDLTQWIYEVLNDRNDPDHPMEIGVTAIGVLENSVPE